MIGKVKDGKFKRFDKGGNSSSVVNVDDVLSLESENPVMNKVVAEKFDGIDESIEAHENKISQFSNPNLLVNPDFRVNLKGLKEYTITDFSRHYTVDKWTCSANANYPTTLTVNDDYVTWKGYRGGGIVQRIENYADFIGKTVTLSAKVKNCNGTITLKIYDGVYGTNTTITDDGIYSIAYTVKENANQLLAYTNCNEEVGIECSIDVEWMKLELGNKATPFVPPVYAEELAKCQLFNETLSKSVPLVLTCARNVYVDVTNGDDITGDGTQEKPWKTIQKAADMCPAISNCYKNYSIFIADGEYTENVDFCQTGNIRIFVYGSNNKDGVVINGSLAFKYCGNTCLQNNITINNVDGAYNSLVIQDNSVCYNNAVLTINGPSKYIGIRVAYNSMFYNNTGTLTIDNAENGIVSFANSNVYLKKSTTTIGSNCTYGLYAEGANIIIKPSLVVNNAVNKTNLSKGGHIIIDSQGWQLIGSRTGSGDISIDHDLYTEFKIEQNYSGRIVDHYLTSAEIKTATSTKEKIGGFYQSSTECVKATIYYNAPLNVIGNNNFYFAGNLKNSETTMTVYGRRA